MARTKTYDLCEERDRIDAELDDLADRAAADDVELTDADRRRAQQLERQYVGLEWALTPPDHEDRDPYERVTLTELTAGSYIKAGAEAAADASEMDVPAGGDIERLYRVTSAIEDAPFVPDHGDGLVAVGQLKPQFFFWLEQRVDDLTTPDIEGNGFAQRVAARQQDQTDATSDASSASSSPE